MSIADYRNSVVNFDTLAPGVLGANRKNIEVVAVLDLDTAMLLSDVRARHAQVKIHVPDLPESAKDYDYVKLRYSNGDIEVLGVPWIKNSSIEVVSSRKMIITIDNLTDGTEELARKALLQNGINFSVEIVGSVAAPT